VRGGEGPTIPPQHHTPAGVEDNERTFGPAPDLVQEPEDPAKVHQGDQRDGPVFGRCQLHAEHLHRYLPGAEAPDSSVADHAPAPGPIPFREEGGPDLGLGDRRNGGVGRHRETPNQTVGGNRTDRHVLREGGQKAAGHHRTPGRSRSGFRELREAAEEEVGRTREALARHRDRANQLEGMVSSGEPCQARLFVGEVQQNRVRRDERDGDQEEDTGAEGVSAGVLHVYAPGAPTMVARSPGSPVGEWDLGTRSMNRWRGRRQLLLLRTRC
jgi:hypothetical protein